MTCDIMLDDLQLFEYIMDLTVSLDSCNVTCVRKPRSVFITVIMYYSLTDEYFS